MRRTGQSVSAAAGDGVGSGRAGGCGGGGRRAFLPQGRQAGRRVGQPRAAGAALGGGPQGRRQRRVQVRRGGSRRGSGCAPAGAGGVLPFWGGAEKASTAGRCMCHGSELRPERHRPTWHVRIAPIAPACGRACCCALLRRNSFNVRLVKASFDFAYQQLTAPASPDESLLTRILRCGPRPALRWSHTHPDGRAACVASSMPEAFAARCAACLSHIAG